MSMKLTLSRFEDRLDALDSRQSSIEELVNLKFRTRDMHSVTDSGRSSCEDYGHFPSLSKSGLDDGWAIPTNQSKQPIGENLKASGCVMKECDMPLLNSICKSVKYVETSLKIVCTINSSKHGFSTELENLQKSLQSHLKYLQHEKAKITVPNGQQTNRKPNTSFKVPSHTFEHLRGSLDDTSATIKCDVTHESRGGHAGRNGYRRRGEQSYNSRGGGGPTASKERYEDHSTSQ